MTFDEKQAELLTELKSKLSDSAFAWLGRNVRLDGPELEHIDTETLRRLYGNKKGGIKDAGLIRNFLWQCWVRIQAKLSHPINGNLRSVWYQRLQPFYRRHDILDNEVRKPSANRSDWVFGVMIETLAELVEKRVLRYQDFGIQQPWDLRGKPGRARPRILILTEKEGLWSNLLLFNKGAINEDDWGDSKPGTRRPPAVTFPSVSIAASNGQPSLIALEYFAEELKKRTSSVLIGALCDYDPYGFLIAMEYTEKLHALGFKDIKTLYMTRWQWFTATQIKEGKDMSKPKTPSEATIIRKWMEKTGGVDGKPIGVHVDVIGQLKILLNVHKWLMKAVKTDDVPDCITILPEDAEELRTELGLGDRLLPDRHQREFLKVPRHKLRYPS